uniref:Uncharacterized protein n=1 Tax=Anguilla anguilla TaxID=7936 RepID=A0A0E9QYH1_ANGAN
MLNCVCAHWHSHQNSTASVFS